jgi:hypothetical protein
MNLNVWIYFSSLNAVLYLFLSRASVDGGDGRGRLGLRGFSATWIIADGQLAVGMHPPMIHVLLYILLGIFFSVSDTYFRCAAAARVSCAALIFITACVPRGNPLNQWRKALREGQQFSSTVDPLGSPLGL